MAGSQDRADRAARSTERRTSQPAMRLIPIPSALRSSAREPIRTLVVALGQSARSRATSLRERRTRSRWRR